FHRNIREARRQVVPTLLANLRLGKVFAKVAEEVEVLTKKLSGLGDCVSWFDRVVRPELNDQTVPVRVLTNAGLLDGEVGLSNGGKDCVDWDDTDRLPFLLVVFGRHEAGPTFDGKLH